jgi:hypothetical protein
LPLSLSLLVLQFFQIRVQGLVPGDLHLMCSF